MFALVAFKYQQLKQYDWANAKLSFWTVANIILFSMIVGFSFGWYVLAPKFLN